MKGVILAGGLGTRLRPLTLVTNKHLLPVYDRPMIYYPIECLVNAGIKDVLVVTGGEHAGDFLKLLKNGKQLGLRHLEYAYQEGEGGIADALKLAEEFADGGKVCVVLGDNIIQNNIRKAAGDFFTQRSGAKLLLKEVPDPQRFGVVRYEGEGAKKKIVEIIEKPKDPPSKHAVIGIYFYDADVFKVYLPFIWALAALSIVNDILKLAAGRWTARLIAFDVLVDVLNFVLALAIFSNPQIWNPAFMDQAAQAGLVPQDGRPFNDLATLWRQGTASVIYVVGLAFGIGLIQSVVRAVRLRSGAGRG